MAASQTIPNMSFKNHDVKDMILQEARVASLHLHPQKTEAGNDELSVASCSVTWPTVRRGHKNKSKKKNRLNIETCLVLLYKELHCGRECRRTKYDSGHSCHVVRFLIIFFKQWKNKSWVGSLPSTPVSWVWKTSSVCPWQQSADSSAAMMSEHSALICVSRYFQKITWLLSRRGGKVWDLGIVGYFLNPYLTSKLLL